MFLTPLDLSIAAIATKQSRFHSKNSKTRSFNVKVCAGGRNCKENTDNTRNLK